VYILKTFRFFVLSHGCGVVMNTIRKIVGILTVVLWGSSFAVLTTEEQKEEADEAEKKASSWATSVWNLSRPATRPSVPIPVAKPEEKEPDEFSEFSEQDYQTLDLYFGNEITNIADALENIAMRIYGLHRWHFHRDIQGYTFDCDYDRAVKIFEGLTLCRQSLKKLMGDGINVFDLERQAGEKVEEAEAARLIRHEDKEIAKKAARIESSTQEYQDLNTYFGHGITNIVNALEEVASKIDTLHRWRAYQFEKNMRDFDGDFDRAFDIFVGLNACRKSLTKLTASKTSVARTEVKADQEEEEEEEEEEENNDNAPVQAEGDGNGEGDGEGDEAEAVVDDAESLAEAFSWLHT